AKKAKIMWLNYPNNPTTALATKPFFKEAIDFCSDNEIILVSDEAYSEMYFDEKPISILELETEGIVAINSLSKRSAMTGYRVGWIAGDERIIKEYKKLKGNIDSGTATFIQDAATAALKDEAHVEKMRNEYRTKRDIMLDAFNTIGLPESTPQGTFYIWQKVPENYNSIEFAKKLLDENTAIVTTPGLFLSSTVNGINPGENYVRFALVPTIEMTQDAAERLKKISI
ncbi:MAG: aminotransferase class I/II-fold pyridoxal phosphate-dependent enzyme, partial [Candidatus Diapherotrites archaeon]|nr:aminotransferase class I/II-fold pyridoxal phosphate-dependent enzyme [Candidatus Diapherotrites archaeon]